MRRYTMDVFKNCAQTYFYILTVKLCGTSGLMDSKRYHHWWVPQTNYMRLLVLLANMNCLSARW